MRIKKFLGFIVLAVTVLLPMSAKAATWGMNNNFTQTENADGTVTVELEFFQSEGNSLTNLSTTMILTNVEVVNVEGVSPWNVTQSGNELTLIASTPETRTSFTAAKVTYKKIDTAKECKIEFVCNGETKTKTPSTPENPKTGNVLPYAVIVAGIAIAGAVYYVTRKNNKLYNI